MGRNIRAGAHYTQFIVYDFDGDGKAEMSVKTAPGTKMTKFGDNGEILSETYITIPKKQVKLLKGAFDVDRIIYVNAKKKNIKAAKIKR